MICDDDNNRPLEPMICHYANHALLGTIYYDLFSGQLSSPLNQR